MSKKKQQPEGPALSPLFSIPGILAALAVLIVVAVLGFVLLNRSVAQEQEVAGSVATELPSQPTTEAPAEQPADVQDMESETEQEESTMSGKTYSQAPPMTIDPSKSYTATITTPRGDIKVKLRPDVAPQTVNNFVFLAREGFYDGLTWHRVIEGFMAQGGDPTGTGSGGPGYTIPAEFSSQISYNKPGVLAMARTSDPNSAGSQFFITTAPAPHLNEQYTAFGEVVSGQDIVNAIPLRDPARATGPGEEILKVTITEE